MNVLFEFDGESFEWDEEKARLNLRKHGVRFEEAATVFFDPFFVLTDASRHDEARDAVIGFDAQGRLLFVVHKATEGHAIRLISARRAQAHEESLYAQ